MLNKKTKYALRSLLYLARHPDDGPVLIATLAVKEGIPRKFLEHILLMLNKEGILASKKGKGGGYFLALPADRIVIGDVVRLMDGPLAPVPCVSKTAYAKCKDCGSESACLIRPVMKKVRDAISDILDQTTLQDMLEEADVSPNYEI